MKHLIETKAATNENLIVRDTKGKIKAIPAKEFLPLVTNKNTVVRKNPSKVEK